MREPDDRHAAGLRLRNPKLVRLRNGPDRCFFCKDELFEVLGPLAGTEGLALAVGTNTDDLGGHRPGQRAAAETVFSGIAAAELGQHVRPGEHVSIRGATMFELRDNKLSRIVTGRGG